MLPFGTVTHSPLGTIEAYERPVLVSLHIAHDNIEYVV